MQRILAKTIRIEQGHLIHEHQLERVNADGMLVLALGLIEKPVEQVVFNRDNELLGRLVVIELCERIPEDGHMRCCDLEIAWRAQSTVYKGEKL